MMMMELTHCEHAKRLLLLSVRNPPWTFVNLAVYFAIPIPFFRRGCYASFWSTLVSFELINFIDRTAHARLAKKQGFPLPVFYAFDVVVHWLPVVCLYVPPLETGELVSKLVSLSANLLWGAYASKCTMNLSEVYIEMGCEKWCLLWTVVCFVTPNVSF
jgi:hypothetical protein